MESVNSKIISNIELPVKSIIYIRAPQGRAIHIQLKDKNGEFIRLCNTGVPYYENIDCSEVEFGKLCISCTMHRFIALRNFDVRFDENRLVEFYNSIRDHIIIRNYSRAKQREFEETSNVKRYLSTSAVQKKYYQNRGTYLQPDGYYLKAHRDQTTRDRLLSGLRHCDHRRTRLTTIVSEVEALVCPGCGELLRNEYCNCKTPRLMRVYEDHQLLDINYCFNCNNFVNNKKLEIYR